MKEHIENQNTGTEPVVTDDNFNDESDLDFEARIAAIESGTMPIEAPAIASSGAKPHSETNDEPSVGDTGSEEDRESDNDDEGEKESDDEVTDANDNEELEDEIKLEDDNISEDNESDPDITNVEGEESVADDAKEENVLKKFNISDEKELENILREYKKSRFFIDDNKELIGKGKLLEKAGVTEEDIGMLLAIKNGDKATVAKLVKKLNIDIDEFEDSEIEPQKVDLKEYKPNELEEKVESFVYEAKAREVEPEKVVQIINTWDEESVLRLLDEKDGQKVIVENIEDGTFDKVQQKIKEIRKSDYSGKFSKQSDYAQYTYALMKVREESSAKQTEKKEDIEPEKKTKTSTKKNNGNKTPQKKKKEDIEDIDPRGASDSAFNKKNDEGQPGTGEIDTSKMTDEEFEEYMEKVLDGEI